MATLFYMSMPNSEGAPRFCSSASEFDAFFDNVEELAQHTRLSITDAISWAHCYARPESKSWQYVPCLRNGQVPAAFTMFKQDVKKLYPHLSNNHCFTIRDLEELAPHTSQLVDMSHTDLGNYYHGFITRAKYLINQNCLSPRERNSFYLKGLPHPVGNHILQRLAIMKPDVLPDDGYQFLDVHAVIKEPPSPALLESEVQVQTKLKDLL